MKPPDDPSATVAIPPGITGDCIPGWNTAPGGAWKTVGGVPYAIPTPHMGGECVSGAMGVMVASWSGLAIIGPAGPIDGMGIVPGDTGDPGWGGTGGRSGGGDPRGGETDEICC